MIISLTASGQNFISASTVREVTSLRQDYYSVLSDIGFVPLSAKPTDQFLNVNGDNTNLIKAVVFGGLWAHIARVALPKATFDQVAAGTVQRDYVAKQFKMYVHGLGRVFLHPNSVLFGVASYKSPLLTYFTMSTTSKTFLRDATEVRRIFASKAETIRDKNKLSNDWPGAFNQRSLYTPYCSFHLGSPSIISAVGSHLDRTGGSDSEHGRASAFSLPSFDICWMLSSKSPSSKRRLQILANIIPSSKPCLL